MDGGKRICPDLVELHPRGDAGTYPSRNRDLRRYSFAVSRDARRRHPHFTNTTPPRPLRGQERGVLLQYSLTYVLEGA